MKIRLKNCYRCESDSVEVLLSKVEASDGKSSVWFAVYCHDCGLEGPEYNTKPDAIEHWNTWNYY